MVVRLSCPSCNTEFTLPTLPENRRALCPRCGDTFIMRGWSWGAESEPDAPVANAPARPAARRMPTGLRVHLIALLATGLGAGVALWVAHNHPPGQQPNPEPRRPDEVIPATGLSGIGYLSVDTNIAFAVQPGPVLAYARRTNQDARELILKLGIPANVLDAILNLGIPLDQIDHIAGGTSFGDAAAELRLTLVLTLRTPPTDEDEFLKRLKAKPQPGGKARHDAELAGLPLTLARISPTVWVFGASAKDFDSVNKGGHGAGCKHLPVGLFEMLTKEVPPEAAAWLATNDERWAEKPGVKLVANTLLKKTEWLESIKKGRAGMAAITFGEQPRMRLFVKATDAETAKKVRAFFAERAGNDEKIRHGGDGDTAFFDTPIDPAKVFTTVQQFLGK